MKNKLQTTFHPRQYMLSKDFEIYYYNDCHDDRLRYKVQNHSHDYYEFYFFLEGNVSILIDGTEYPLKAGNMVLIPPGITHRAIIHDTNVPYRRFVFWISEAFCWQLQKESRDYVYLTEKAREDGHCIFHYDMVVFHTLQSKIFQLLEEIHSEHFGKSSKILLCVRDLLLQLNRAAFEQENPKAKKEASSLYQNLLQYMEAHFDEELSLDLLAQEFYVSKYHISHVFKENLGLSVHQYLTKKRLLMCRDAILGQGKISEVYQRYGFQDYSSFFRSFKKEFGMSPKKYKELCSQGSQEISCREPN